MASTVTDRPAAVPARPTELRVELADGYHARLGVMASARGQSMKTFLQHLIDAADRELFGNQASKMVAEQAKARGQ